MSDTKSKNDDINDNNIITYTIFAIKQEITISHYL